MFACLVITAISLSAFSILQLLEMSSRTSVLLVSDFLPKTRELIHRLKNQGAVQHTSIRHLRKIIQRHQDDFSHFRVETEEMLSQIFDWCNLSPNHFFSFFIPYSDGSPIWECTSQHTTVVDHKFIPHMPAVLLQIKFQSKGHWTCCLAVNTMCE